MLGFSFSFLRREGSETEEPDEKEGRKAGRKGGRKEGRKARARTEWKAWK